MRLLRFCFVAVGAAGIPFAVRCGGAAFTSAPFAGDGGGTTDASPVDDGADDVEAAAPPPHFCTALSAGEAGAPYLCADFDEGNLKRGWDTQQVSRLCDQKLDPTFAKSEPDSFLADTIRAVGGDGGVEESLSVLQKDLGHLKTMDLSFDVYMESYGTDLDGGVSSLDSAALFIMSFGYVNFSLAVTTPASAAFGESAQPDGGAPIMASHTLSTGLAVGQWQHVDVQLTPGASATPGTVSITFDGNAVLPQTPLAAGTLPTSDGVLTLGIFLFASPNLWRVHYDNVVVTKT